MKTLLLDNYDSFSHILYQYLWEVNGERPHFVRNDEWTLDRIRSESFDNILISPGPGRPDRPGDFGVCAEVIRAFPDVPILGVCLGHQGLGHFGGGAVISAPEVRHGKPSRILHDGRGLFEGLPQGFEAVRYHSLVVSREGLPPGIEITATSEDDSQIMGLRLPSRPGYGVQFHPESIGTAHGKALLANFRKLTEEWKGRGAAVPRGASHGRRPGIPQADITAPSPSDPAPPSTLAASHPRKPRLPAAQVELPWADPEAVFQTLFTPDASAALAYWLDAPAPPVPGETRASYMGTGRLLHEVRGPTLRSFDPAHPEAAEVREGDPFALLQALIDALPDADLPFAFRGGLVGWLGYGLKRHAGGGDLPATPASDLPDALFLEPSRFLRFDPGARKVIAHLRPDSGAEDLAWLQALPGRWAALSAPPALDLGRAGPDPRSLSGFRTPWTLSAPKPRYLESIQSLQQAIREGETYEACLTNELRASSDPDPWTVYRVLRRTNPAPYAAFLRFPGLAVLSSSPERFLRLEAGGNAGPGARLTSRPIKGTRPRGDTPAEDAALRASLASHPKDRSENLMIVDLVRNDFGKVCALGTVTVPESMVVEEHPTVFQLVSEVEGRLIPGTPALEAVRACFPGGSMTGAPKKRTMELLEAREGRDRGIFSGALGWLGSDGSLDLGMVIRTLVHQGGEYRIGCGGAILAESDPEGEFEETLLKAYAPLRALELARFRTGGGWVLGP
jgi:para-aminobenzoate synthetase